jgi:hypothetical protein
MIMESAKANATKLQVFRLLALKTMVIVVFRGIIIFMKHGLILIEFVKLTDLNINNVATAILTLNHHKSLMLEFVINSLTHRLTINVDFLALPLLV